MQYYLPGPERLFRAFFYIYKAYALKDISLEFLSSGSKINNMKTIIYSLCTLLLFSISSNAYAQKLIGDEAIEDVLLKKGYTLTWENNSFGKSFFYIEINSFNLTNKKKPIVIDVNFSMSLSKSLKGNIIMKANAVNYAMKMHNYFAEGNTELEDKTTVWLSKKASQLVKNNKSFEIEVKPGLMVNMNTFSKETYKMEVINLSGEVQQYSIPAIKASNDKGEYIMIFDSPNNSNPMILQMELPGLNLAFKSMNEK